MGFLYWSFRRPGLCGFLCCSPAPDQPPGGGVGLSVTVIAPLQASWLLEQSFASPRYGLSLDIGPPLATLDLEQLIEPSYGRRSHAAARDMLPRIRPALEEARARD